jgi:TldD protein
MKISRRGFVGGLSVAAGAVAIGNLIPAWSRRLSRPEADLTALTDVALGTARALGCAYASMGINRKRDGSVSHGAGACVAVTERERLTFDVRVLHSGAWGRAAGSALTTDEVARATSRAVALARASAARADRPPEAIPLAARKDCWSAPHDRVHRPLEAQVASLVAAGNRSARTFAAEESFFVSSKGGFDHSTRLRVA